MLYFLYGKDTYRLKQKLRAIIDRCAKVNKSALSLEDFDFNSVSFAEFFDSFKQTSLFVKKKLFILENTFLNEDAKREFFAKIDFLDKSEQVVCLKELNPIDANDKAFQALIQKAKVQEFKELNNSQTRTWANREFSKYNAVVNNFALSGLIAVFDSDLWGLSNAIKTLSCYKKNITEKEVRLFFKKVSWQADIFKVVENIARNDKKVSLSLLQVFLEQGEPPLRVLAMIAWQFKTLILAKQNQLRAHPFVQKKARALAFAFSLARLKEIFQKILETDFKIKTGQAQAVTALQDLILFV